MTDLATARAECCRKIAEKLETNPILWTERREQAGVGQISNRGMWSAFNMHHPVEPRDFFTDAAAARSSASRIAVLSAAFTLETGAS